LPVGSGERDVVYTLALQLLHRVHRELSTEQAWTFTSGAAKLPLAGSLDQVALPERIYLRSPGQGGVRDEDAVGREIDEELGLNIRLCARIVFRIVDCAETAGHSAAFRDWRPYPVAVGENT
jgi:hypothetical protein